MDAAAVWDGSTTTELKAAGAEAIPAAVQVTRTVALENARVV
jgi:hypothetical protein